MGKPFQSELLSLSQTYEWAVERDLAPLSRLREELANRSLYTIGSGGSLSAAAYGAYLHSKCGEFASALTPLDFCARRHLRDSAVLIYSAGGGNVDVIAALRHGLQREADVIGTICLVPGSKLATLSRQYQYLYSWAESSPVDGDGFLATNSLLAFFVLSHRLFEPQVKLPTSYARLGSLAHYSERDAQKLVQRDHLIVLHGPSTGAAAIDFESKMSEAGLSSVQLADYRNFAHGRHNWIAKKANSTGVLSLCAREDWEIADKTVRILRNVCPVTEVKIDGPSSLASLAALPAIFDITKFAGTFRRIDPGRPGVPPFGRQIYNLKPTNKQPLRPGASPTVEDVLARKFNLCAANTPLTQLKDAAHAVHQELLKREYGALVLDFDDTLCGRSERFGSLRDDIAVDLERIAASGIPIGIATGRGRSVRVQLRDSIEEKYWSGFTIGYYNGAELAPLADDGKPDAGTKAEGILTEAADLLLADRVTKILANITVRPRQVTLEPSHGAYMTLLWKETVRCLAHLSASVKVVHSSRSVDVVTTSTSKCSLITAMSTGLKGNSRVLCIGDQGSYPGNDFELLSHPYSLSSDRCSMALDSCWNFAPIGYRGVQATKYYLQKLLIGRGGLRLRLPQLR